MRVQVAFALLVVIACQVYAEESAGKVLSFFNVVKFPNSLCTGSGTRNGTCYTTEECEDRSGTAAGSCADGFGVCCVITMDCGGTTSENNTYFVKAAFTTATAASCSFTVCPASTEICRMKLDFKTFAIAGPSTTAATAKTLGNALGDCATDSFTAPGAPVICGTNTGQHIFIDSDGASCAMNTFSFDTSGTGSKSMDIMITQYDCKSNVAGAPGCLQYFTGSTGTVSSFNFANAHHLSDQNYDMCIRREKGMCSICYTPAASTNAFGLSVSPSKTAAESAVAAECLTDFLVIPEGATVANAKSTTVTANASKGNRFCGRELTVETAKAQSAIVSVCSATRPFKISFVSDGGEAVAGTDSSDDELTTAPLGTVGFSLNFVQQSC